MEDVDGGNEDGLQRVQSEVRETAVISVHRESQSDNIPDPVSPQYATVRKSSKGSGSGEERHHSSEDDTDSETGRDDNSEIIFVYPDNDEEHGEADSGIIVRDKIKSQSYDPAISHTVVTISNGAVASSHKSHDRVVLVPYETSDVIGAQNKLTTRELDTLSSTHGNIAYEIERPWSISSDGIYESSMEPIPAPIKSVQKRNHREFDESIQVLETGTVSYSVGKRQPRFNTGVSTTLNFYDDGFLEAMKWRTKKRYSRRRKKYLAAIVVILIFVLLLIAVVVCLLLYSNGTFGHFPMGTGEKGNGGNVT